MTRYGSSSSLFRLLLAIPERWRMRSHYRPTHYRSGHGSDTHIDVSGDSSVGIVPVGVNPVFLGKTSNRAFVINRGDPTATCDSSFGFHLYRPAPKQRRIHRDFASTSVNPVAGFHRQQRQYLHRQQREQ